jgi:hypothetical protein
MNDLSNESSEFFKKMKKFIELLWFWIYLI